MKKYALISVFDKTGIVNFAKSISSLEYNIISTGGTAKVLAQNNIPVIPIQEVTGNPESFDGRMKTISFQIESGILYDRQNPSHVKQAKELEIKPIDLVVCNLYPFEQTIQKQNVSEDEAIENIDVGGPTMIRAAAKNFKNVVIVVDPKDYQNLLNHCHSEKHSDEESRKICKEILHNVSDDKRRELAAKAFFHLSFYDSQIASYLTDELFPQEITLAGRKSFELRYGENPHQQGAAYLKSNTHSPFNDLARLWGREASWMNIADINAGLEVVKLFREPCAVVIKHNNPCGIATGKTPKEALKRAIDADPESAFGGIIVLNKPMDLPAAKVIGSFKESTKGNMDIVAVPSIDDKALEYLKMLRKSMGIYVYGSSCHSELGSESISNEMLNPVQHDKYNLKWIEGGFILQTPDENIEESFKDWKVVTKKKPSKKQLGQMKIAWKFISRIKSNAIIIVDAVLPMTRGIGTGQTSRVRSTKIALEQAGKHNQAAILASDAFFPFDDSVKLAGKIGIKAIVQPGGSINDQASIDAADKLGMVMVFTGRRAFWH